MPDPIKNGKSVAINKETAISLGLVAILVGAAVWLNGQLMQIDFRLQNIEIDLRSAGYDRWRGQDMENWAVLLQALNPELHVPEVVPDSGSD